MKKLLIVILALIACSLMSEEIKISWTANPDNERIDYYEVYKAEGNDSTNLPLVLIDTVNHGNRSYGDSVEFISTMDFNYVRAGLRAINSISISPMTISRVYSKEELFPPAPATSPAGFFIGVK